MQKQKLYVAVIKESEGYNVLGVYSTKEKAIMALHESWAKPAGEVMELELDAKIK